MSDDNCPECKWTYYPYCICPELKDAFRRGVDSVTLTVVSDMYRKGYTAGVRAARDAVAAVPREDGGYCHVLHACDVEAAIDALRGDTASRISTGYDPTATDNRP